MRFSSSSTLLVLASFVTLVLPYYGASAAAIGDGGVELLTNGQRLARGMKPAQPRKLFEADKVIGTSLQRHINSTSTISDELMILPSMHSRSLGETVPLRYLSPPLLLSRTRDGRRSPQQAVC